MKEYVCANCGKFEPYLLENMCQRCYDEAMKGSRPTCEAWFERIHKQIDDILKEIRAINEKLKGV